MITTIRIRDIIKYLVILTTIIAILVSGARYFFYIKNKKVGADRGVRPLQSLIQIVLPWTHTLAVKENENTKGSISSMPTSSRSGLVRILALELPIVEKDNSVGSDTSKGQGKTNAGADASVRPNETENKHRVQIKDTYTYTYKTVKIKNLTGIKLSENMVKPDYMVKNKKDIIIYHTHTCESYTPAVKNNYKETGNFRTTNLKYSVVRVGDELTKELQKHKYRVIHNNTKHDYPAYTGSYSRSLETIEKILSKQKNTDILFDVHRDAVGNKGTYAPTVKIKGEEVAQLMFVIGTNDGGGNHPNWQNNLKFAVRVQEKANEMYPGLFRAINLRSATFNQKVRNGASIIEVGATGNTLEEAEASMKYLAKVLNEVLK